MVLHGLAVMVQAVLSATALHVFGGEEGPEEDALVQHIFEHGLSITLLRRPHGSGEVHAMGYPVADGKTPHPVAATATVATTPWTMRPQPQHWSAPTHFDPLRLGAYCQSKLANVLFSQELDRRFKAREGGRGGGARTRCGAGARFKQASALFCVRAKCKRGHAGTSTRHAVLK